MIYNEYYDDLKEAMQKYEIDFQLAPLHMHRRNAAERAIWNYKNHFIAWFSTTDPDLPISEWYRLLCQYMITLNLLQDSRVKPSLSEDAYLFGSYDFNKSPIEPPGTRMVVHGKPGNCRSLGHHGTPGWYIGQSLDHYRFVQCYMPVTVILRITYTLQYIPKEFAFLTTTTKDYLQQAIGDTISIMKEPPNKLLLFYYLDATKNAINHIAHILHRSTSQPRLQILP